MKQSKKSKDLTKEPEPQFIFLTAELRKYSAPCPIATKIYKTVGPNQWLLTRKSMSPLGDNRILGVLRKRVFAGVDVAAPRVSLIEQYAATRVYTADQASETFYSTGSSQIALQLVITPDFDGLLQVTSFHDARYVPSGGITSIAGLCITNLALSSLGSPLASGGIQEYFSDYSTHSQSLSYSVTTGTPYYLQLIVGSASTGMYLRAASLRAELIKR